MSHANQREAPSMVEVAIAVVLDAGGRVLVGTRQAESALAGLAEFPGGKIEPHERPADAARRECREEAGVDIRVDGLLASPIEHEYAHANVRLHFFACEALTDAAPLPPYRFVAIEVLKELEFPAANRPILQLLRERQRKAC